MPGVVRKTDNCSGHGCFPPRPATSWSPNVFVNNLNVIRKDDTLESHCCGPVCHDGVYQGTHNVFVNGRDIQIHGDPIDCGSSCDECSPNVNVN